MRSMALDRVLLVWLSISRGSDRIDRDKDLGRSPAGLMTSPRQRIRLLRRAAHNPAPRADALVPDLFSIEEEEIERRRDRRARRTAL